MIMSQIEPRYRKPERNEINEMERNEGEGAEIRRKWRGGKIRPRMVTSSRAVLLRYKNKDIYRRHLVPTIGQIQGHRIFSKSPIISNCYRTHLLPAPGFLHASNAGVIFVSPWRQTMPDCHLQASLCIRSGLEAHLRQLSFKTRKPQAKAW